MASPSKKAQSGGIVTLMSEKHITNSKSPILVISIIVAVLVAILIFSVIGDDSQPSTEVVQNSNTDNTTASITPKNESSEDKIKKIIDNTFTLKQTDTGLDKVGEVDITRIEDDESYNVEVKINSDSYQGLSSLENESADIYIALYTSAYEVSKATVHGYHQFSDEYGNLTNEKVLTTHLDKAVASKINFSADEFDLRMKIIPNLWNKTFTNHKNGY